MSYRDYSTSKGHIVDASGFGDFTTIQAAINAAVSGQDIFVSAGTYTEDITLIAGINVRASLGDSVTPIVKITGNLTYTGVGNATISGARLTTNSNFLITVSGSNASVLHVINCDLHCTNNTGISFTNSNAASQILLEQCTGNLTTTGIAYHTSSSAGTLAYRYSTFNNTGASTTASTNSAGSVVWSYGAWLSPISCSSTGTMECDYFLNDCSAINTTTITTAGSGTSLFRDCIFLSGTASTISVGTGSTVDLYDATIRSSNTNAITGAGTIKYTEVGFTGTSSTINTTTQTPLPLTVQQGGTFNSTFTAYSVIAAGTTATGAFQNVSGVGSSGQVLTSNGAAALPTWQSVSATGAFDQIAIQTFTSSGTYTPTTGMKYCIAEVVGSGGGGGGTAATGATTLCSSTGGGGGEYRRGVFTAAAVGASQTITLNAGGAGGVGNATGSNGGTSVFGTLITSNGGTGGTTFGSAAASGSIAGPVNGGTGGSGGTVIVPGAPGNGGGIFSNTPALLIGGGGGSTPFGYGPNAILNTTGAAGTGFGSGGSGVSVGNNVAAQTGGAGAKGIIVITEFISV